MSDLKKKYELEILKHQLTLLTIEQERDQNILHQYEIKQIPEHTEFVQKKRREVNLRDRRIQRLKEQIDALERE